MKFLVHFCTLAYDIDSEDKSNHEQSNQHHPLPRCLKGCLLIVGSNMKLVMAMRLILSINHFGYYN